MSSTSFKDDLKHMMRDAANGARERLTAIQGGVQPALGKMRSLSASTKKKIAVCGAAIGLLAIGLAMRGERTPVAPRDDRPQLRASDLKAVQEEAPRPPPRAAQRSYAVAKADFRQGDYRAAAENYANAARKGDQRGLKKLVAMTHAPKCEARAEAADALGTFKSKKATAALKKLARARFKDEPASPGIFSCSSRRAAEKALEKQRG